MQPRIAVYKQLQADLKASTQHTLHGIGGRAAKLGSKLKPMIESVESRTIQMPLAQRARALARFENFRLVGSS
jgi:hypothetical protein